MHRFIAAVKFFRKLILRSPKWDNAAEFWTGTRIRTHRGLQLDFTCHMEGSMGRGDDVCSGVWCTVRSPTIPMGCGPIGIFMSTSTCVHHRWAWLHARTDPSISHELPWWGAGSHRKTEKKKKTEYSNQIYVAKIWLKLFKCRARERQLATRVCFFQSSLRVLDFNLADTFNCECRHIGCNDFFAMAMA